MTALAGLASFGATVSTSEICAGMLAAQGQYGPHGSAVKAFPGAAIGRCIYRLLPEDRFDTQPESSADGRYTIVADIRIDNRDELLAKIGLSLAAARLSDTAILMRSFERWGEAVIDHLVGDFAFAVWDNVRRALILVRDPLGLRPLHFHCGTGWAAFASMPDGLFGHPEIPRQVDTEAVTEFVADLPREGRATFFSEIQRVEPGHVLVIDQAGVQTRSYWNPEQRDLGITSPGELVEAFREHLDRATLSRLRGTDAVVAAHLSSGWDSGAVAATAARLMGPGGKVLAFTAAPAEAFSGPVPRGRIADETCLARHVADNHPNIEHVVLRPRGVMPLTLLGANDLVVGQPTGYPCNNVWWTAINSLAAARSVTVVLTGEMGNHTISAGGVLELADLARRGEARTWLREARALVSNGTIRWRGVLDNSFGAMIPLYKRFRPYLQGVKPSLPKASLVAPEWRQEMESRLAVRGRQNRSSQNSFQYRLSLLKAVDSGNFRKGSLAQWGVDERDPTADRRLIEFCLSLPSDALLRDGVRRPLARAALSDRLPASLLDSQTRGYQMADWYEQINAQDISAAMNRASPSAAAVVDLVTMREMVERWPASGWAAPATIADYRMGLLRAIAATSFVSSFDEANESAY